MNHPSEDRTSRRPYVAPTVVCLIGRDLDVVHALEILREVFTVTDVSSLQQVHGPANNVRLYAHLSRNHPLTGGTK